MSRTIPGRQQWNVSDCTSVLSQPPEVRVTSISAIVDWAPWGSHPMDTGDGPIVGYKIYFSNPIDSSWVEAGNLNVSLMTYKHLTSFSFEIEHLQQLTVYNFSVAAVREGTGGEGPKSPVTTIRTEPQAAELDGPSVTIAESNLSLIIAVCVFVVVIVIVVVVDYLRFRRLSRRLSAMDRPTGNALNMAAYDNAITKEKPSRMSMEVRVDDYENAMAAGSSDSAYEVMGQAWTDSLAIPFDRLSIGYTVIGTGHFGEVCLATVMLEDGQSKAAVKQLMTNSSAGDRNRFMEEHRTLARVGAHANIVNILAVCFDQGVVYVALEYQPNGDLRSYLRNVRSLSDGDDSPLSAGKLLQFAVDVARGMQHVAAAGVIHRKLAARSIFLDSNLVAKVAGFGQAKCAETIVEKSKESFPPRWLSLESLKSKTFNSKSDVWSFGVLFWEIATLGATPYSGIKSSSLVTRLENGYRMPEPPNCDGEIYKLMLQCWQENPNDRPPFKQLASVLGAMTHSHKQRKYMQMLPKHETHHYLNIRVDQDDN